MAVETAADLAVFFNTDEWAVSATYEGDTVSVIFDAAHIQAVTGAEVPVSTVQPVALIRDSELPNDADQGDGVTINGTAYEVADIQPDGTGLTLLVLQKP